MRQPSPLCINTNKLDPWPHHPSPALRKRKPLFIVQQPMFDMWQLPICAAALFHSCPAFFHLATTCQVFTVT